MEHEREALNLMCLLLYHAGLLYPYSASDKPCDVLVVNPLYPLEAKFHCWYIKKTDNTGISFQAEYFFREKGMHMMYKLFYICNSQGQSGAHLMLLSVLIAQ